MKYLIVGLGNPGAEYELTRHNIGFLTLDRYADNEKVKFSTQRLADKAEVRYKGRTLTLIKPNTFMNLSGKAMNYWMNDLKVPLENVFVIVDDIALPFGSLRLRGKGSSAGHNGLTNIEETLNTQNYTRLKFGIGNNFPKGGQVDYVLGRFTDEEFKALPTHMDKAIQMIQSFCTAGLERTMSGFND
jgi:peptidyl-tRNA hydrolase, PTH1 family